MHTDSASLLNDVALIAICILAVGFLIWFLVALSLEGNGRHVHFRMEFRLDNTAATAGRRQSIREVAARPGLAQSSDYPQLLLQPADKLITHRALRVGGLEASGDLADKSLEA